jgi:hypothetical protein
VQFTGGEPLAGGTGRAFIAGFDIADGAATDTTLFDPETAAVRGLALDGAGKIYAAGGCDGNGVTGVLIATWTGQADPGAYRCEYTASTSETTALGVALDPNGGLVLGGKLSAAVMGWPDPAILADSSRGFIARIDAPLDLTGPVVPKWLATLGGDHFTQNRVNAVALRDGEVVAAARGSGLTRLRGTGDIDCGDECDPTLGFAIHNTAVVRLGGDGSCIGASVLCSDSEAAEEIWGLAATPDRIYVTGQFEGSLLLGGQDLTSAPHPAGVRTFVMSLDTDLYRDAGAWVLLSDDEEDTDCGVGPDSLVVAGSVCGPGLSLGDATFMPGPQSYDGFVVKLAR